MFVSFASPQSVQVEVWIKHLETASYRCFFSDKSIGFSKDWAEEIWSAMRVCCCFMPVVTPAWTHSRWCAYEFGAALVLNKPIVPIIVGKVRAPQPLTAKQGFTIGRASDLIALNERNPKLWQRITRELRKLCYRDRDVHKPPSA